ncbi:hypothetical protein QFZ58_000172 [Streptomyces sp. B1I3]|nr:hypothetical protein [Streptomyces sp. B1I3]
MTQAAGLREVMFWLAKDGGAGPLGAKRERLEIGGAVLDLYVGDIGWNVHSIVRVGNTASADLNLDDFLQARVGRGLVAPTDHLSPHPAFTRWIRPPRSRAGDDWRSTPGFTPRSIPPTWGRPFVAASCEQGLRTTPHARRARPGTLPRRG